LRRSAGITAAAVVALVGSAGVAFLAVIGLFGMLFASRLGSSVRSMPQAGPIPVVAAAILGSLFNLGFAGWGLATGIGLLRLKPWSRISALIFAGLLAFSTAIAALIFLFIPLPEAADTSQNFGFIFRASIESFCLVPLFIAVWWLVFFTRKSVASHFSVPPDMTMSPVAQAVISPPTFVPGKPRMQRPVILTFFAWFYLLSVIASVPWYFVGQFRRMPFPFFGTLLEGKSVAIYLVLSSGLLLAAGIGLLQNRIWGYWIAIGTQLFGFLNIGATLLLPGRADRLERYLKSIPLIFPPEMHAPPMSYFGIVLALSWAGGMILSAVLLWFMWTCRRNFFEFVAVQSRPEPHAE
jgi:hypothetical protein